MISLGRPPIESPEPVVKFAAVRLLLTLSALVALAVTHFENHGRLTLVVAGAALPWAVAMLYVSRRWPDVALNPLVAAGDLGVVTLAELAVPQTYAPARFLALFFIYAHAQFQGPRGGLVIATLGCAALVPIAASNDDGPVQGELLAFYESLFVLCAFAGAITAGNIRTSETAGRLRARQVSRRMIETESEIRRRVADSLHDGPIQELVSLDMMLAALPGQLESGDLETAHDTLREAQAIAERNIRALRDEIVALGPYAFRELSLETAIVECVPVWRRRFGVEVRLDIEQISLPPELSGPLFQIAQEAVTNAGRHANASTVSVSVAERDGQVELRVEDDGVGFGDLAPAMSEGSGHIGLASMRERAELIHGRLSIESSRRGTTVKVRVPLNGQSPKTEPAKDAGRPQGG